MSERRSLIERMQEGEGLSDAEHDIIFDTKQAPSEPPATSPKKRPASARNPVPETHTQPLSKPAPSVLPQMVSRTPITLRCKPHIAGALKRIALERELAGTRPYYMQEIMEFALEQWIVDNGYHHLLEM